MREKRAQIILLVRAFEESDPDGLILPHRERAKATRRALMVTGLSGEQGERSTAWQVRVSEAVMRRSRMLFGVLARRHPAVPRILRLSQLGSSTLPLLVAGALLAGLLTNALGFQRRINLLSFPLLGLLAWNLAMYGLLLVAPLLRRRLVPSGACARFLCEKLFRGALWRRVHGSRVADGVTSSEGRVLAKAVTRFGALWHRLAGPLLAVRVRRMLHLGAMALVAGAVVGMYLRGVAFEYRATWESTWLDGSSMQRLLDVVLGPAAAALGTRVPEVAPLRGPGGSGDAAPWIHLYAMTATLFVLLPRMALVLVESWRSFRMASSLPLDLGDIYYRTMFSAWRGATCQVIIAPYSFTPQPGALATVKTLLFDYFGARADVRARDPVPYGGEAEQLLPAAAEPPATEAEGAARADELETCLVVLFNMAQTPESEVHGRLLDELTSALDRRRDQLLVVLDGSSFAASVRDPERLGEREEAWKRVVREAGLCAIRLDRSITAGRAKTAIEDGADLMGAVRAALWPTSDGTVAS